MRILDLEILAISDRLIVSGQEREGGASRPLSIMEEQPYPAEAIAQLVTDVHRCLRFQREPGATRTRLEQLGLQLFDLLFGRRIKALIISSEASHLVLRLQSSLLDIPWELLHTGSEFLCLRFAIGRTVSLEATVSAGFDRVTALKRPFRMLILCDPRGDLPHAAREGMTLLRTLSQQEADLRVDLLAAPISRRQVIEELRRYDVVHYAGHAEASSSGGASGWLLDDLPFTAGDVVQMQGSRAFPALIFANACLSGSVEGFGADALPRAFLGAGVHHYLGAMSDLPDQTGERAAARFYEALLEGASVGGALRTARAGLAADPGIPSLAWAGYVLYGDPTTAYLGAAPRASGPGTAAGTGVAVGASISGASPTGGLAVLEAVSAPGLPHTSGPVVPQPGSTEARVEGAGAAGSRAEVPGAPASWRALAATGGTNERPSGAVASSAAGDLSDAAFRPGDASARRDAPGEGRTHLASERRVARRRLILPVCFGLLLGMALGLLGESGALGKVDLVWEGVGHAFAPAAPGFKSHPVLLSLKLAGLPRARGLYADLLETLTSRSVIPKVVAIDAWLEADRRTEDDSRLVRAIAEAIEHFPVVLGLETDRSTGRVTPPPAWFERDLLSTLAENLRTGCEAWTKKNRDFPPPLKGCEDPATLSNQATTLYRNRVLWGSVWVQRPRGVVRQLGWRIPVVLEAEPAGDGASAQVYQWPHFSMLLAFPEQGGLEPASATVRSTGSGALAGYDRHGRIPVVFSGRASWDGNAGCPAYDLEEVLEGWRCSEQRGPCTGKTTLDPQALNAVRLLVGVADRHAKGNEMDLYDSPIGEMFGVEVLANVAESLVERTVPRRLPWAWPGVIAAMAAGALGGALSLSSRKRLWPLAGVVALLMVGSSYLLLSVARVSWPPTAALLALAGATWGPRRLRGGGVAAALLVLLLLWGGPQVLAASSAGGGERGARAGQAAPAGSSGRANPAASPRAGQAVPAGSSGTANPAASPRAALLPHPRPPAVPVPAHRVDGWRLVEVQPREVLAGGALSLSTGPFELGVPVPPGAVLRSSVPTVEVRLEFRDSARGMLVHHALWGSFVATLGADGELEIASGTVWSRLFRFLEDSLAPLSIRYDGTPAGFGSTEVVYERQRRMFATGTLSVIEGHVRYERSGRELQLVAGRQARWGRRPGAGRPMPADRLQHWIDEGTRLEVASLPARAVCAARLPDLARSTMVTRACFQSAEARDAGLKAARAGLAMRPEADTWRQMGDVYLAAGQLERAADSYRRGVATDGSGEARGRAWLELGNVRWLQGQPAAARAAFEAAAQVAPEQAPAWNNLGILQWSAGELEAARASLTKAVESDPGMYEAWRNLGRVLVSSSPAEAAAAWERAAALSGQDAGLWRDIGLSWSAVGQGERAVEALKRSTGIDPEQAEVWYRLGQWYWEQGRKAEAIDAYNRAAEIESRGH